MRVVSQDKTIAQILTANFFRIPRFQRPYSWSKDNVDEFWKDSIGTVEKEYFIGSMVVYKDSNHLGLVDGQQRLTTITIILAAVRDHFNTLGLRDLAEGLQSHIERKNLDNKPEFVLQPETSYPYFQEKIQKLGTSETAVKEGDEELALKDAYTYVDSALKDKIAEIRNGCHDQDSFLKAAESFLKECRDKVLNLKLIFIELDNEDDAYIIFETLNTRGKDLEISDLAKNHFFKQLKNLNANVDIPKDQWKAIVKTIESSKFDITMNEYLLHYWLSRHSYVTQKALFKDLKEKINVDNTQSEFSNLVKYAEDYRSLFDPDFKKWQKDEFLIQSSLHGLSLFNVRQPYPAVLSALNMYRDKKMRISDLINLVSLIERFHFISSAVVGQRSSGSLSKAYAKFGRELRGAADNAQVVALVKVLKETLTKHLPKKDEFVVGFKNILFTEKVSKQKKLVQYILARIDSAHRKDPPVKYDLMTIEHLLPQTGNNDEVVGQLGNLIYVSQKLNEELGTKPFVEKLKILEEINFPLIKSLSKYADWGQASIEERTLYLAEISFNDIWKI